MGAEGDREDQQSSAPGEEEGGEQTDEEAGGQQLQLRPQDHQVQVDARLPLKHVPVQTPVIQSFALDFLSTNICTQNTCNCTE